MTSFHPSGENHYSKRIKRNSAPRKGKLEPLSLIETEVAIAVAHGYNNVRIAKELGLRLKTIHNIKNRCYKKLNMRKRDGLQPQVMLTLWTLQKLNRLFALPHTHVFKMVYRCSCGIEQNN